MYVFCFFHSQVFTNVYQGPFELAKNAIQTSVLMSSVSVSDATGPFGSDATASRSTARVSTLQAIRLIVRRHGVLGLYTGFHLHLLRETIGSGLYFGVYESTKQIMTTYSGADKANSRGAVLVAGGLCGVGAWLFVSAAHVRWSSPGCLLTILFRHTRSTQ